MGGSGSEASSDLIRKHLQLRRICEPTPPMLREPGGLALPTRNDMHVQMKDRLPRRRSVELGDMQPVRGQGPVQGFRDLLHRRHYLRQRVWLNIQNVARL